MRALALGLLPSLSAAICCVSDAPPAPDATSAPDVRADATRPTIHHTPGTPLAFEDFEGMLAEKLCASFFACPNYVPTPLWSQTAATLAGPDCVERARSLVHREVELYGRRLATGALVYDPMAADRCAQRLGCEALLWTPLPHFPFGLPDPLAWMCPDAFDGLRHVDIACWGDSDCVDDAHCTFADDTCPGRCTAGSGLLGACRRDAECAWTEGGALAACDHTSDADGVCRELVVGPTAVVGQPCGFLREDDKILLVGCNDGRCDYLGGRVGVCAQFVAEGGRCTDPEECAMGFSCGGDPAVCTRIQIATRVGAPCGDAICDPFADLACDDQTSRCQARPRRTGLGEACELATDSGCADDLYCRSGDDGSSRCAALEAEGAPCGGDEACTTGVCDGTDDPPRCVTRRCEL